MRRGGVHYTAEADIGTCAAIRHGALLPDSSKIGEVFEERFTANLVPGFLRPERRLELGEVLLIFWARLDLCIDELPHVAHHIQRMVGTLSLLETIGLHDLVFR